MKVALALGLVLLAGQCRAITVVNLSGQGAYEWYLESYLFSQTANYAGAEFGGYDAPSTYVGSDCCVPCYWFDGTSAYVMLRPGDKIECDGVSFPFATSDDAHAPSGTHSPAAGTIWDDGLHKITVTYGSTAGGSTSVIVHRSEDVAYFAVQGLCYGLACAGFAGLLFVIRRGITLHSGVAHD